MPQENSGLSFINKGPGSKSNIKKAPSNTAVAADPGIPKVSKGTIAPAVAALLELSGAIRPGIWPFPNFSGSLESFFSVVYVKKEAIVAPAPGKSPETTPITEDMKKEQVDLGSSFNLCQFCILFREHS